MKYILLLAFLVGCGGPETTYNSTDTELEPALRELEQLSQRYAGIDLDTNIPVNFGDLDTIGKCRKVSKNGKTGKEIFIDRDFYNRADHYTVLATILHEIGHCNYDRSHTTRKISLSGVRVSHSIMGEKGVPGTVFRRNMSYFWQEFYGLR